MKINHLFAQTKSTTQIYSSLQKEVNHLIKQNHILIKEIKKFSDKIETLKKQKLIFKTKIMH
jgi:hypothetical protein